ncbi:hypothetical protein GQ44DRAFT_733349 [Phaeosphaeriaceae sp. PMI808]|nr:hypothetical protein GQ44DRAFT_733349 [Phaeosphaeriaceae sp. PMI808]
MEDLRSLGMPPQTGNTKHSVSCAKTCRTAHTACIIHPYPFVPTQIHAQYDMRLVPCEGRLADWLIRDDPSDILMAKVRKILRNEAVTDNITRRIVNQVEISLEEINKTFTLKKKIVVIAKVIKQLAIKLGPLEENRRREDLLQKSTRFLQTEEGVAWMNGWFVKAASTKSKTQSPHVSPGTPPRSREVTGVSSWSFRNNHGEHSQFNTPTTSPPGMLLTDHVHPARASNETAEVEGIVVETLNSNQHRRIASTGQNAPGSCPACGECHGPSIIGGSPVVIVLSKPTILVLFLLFFPFFVHMVFEALFGAS